MTSGLPDEPYAQTAALMSTFPRTWFLCGGWAVDAWLGRQTREHGDVDIAVFHDDQRWLFEHFTGWDLVAHHPGVADDTSEAWDGRPIDLPAHVHGRPLAAGSAAASDAADAPPPGRLELEILLNERAGGDWLLSREPRVALPIERAVRRGSHGLPVAVPEVLMFFKATAYPDDPTYPRPEDLDDFLAVAPLLSPLESDWLRGAIAQTAPVHPWLSHLPGTA